ncbi:MAG: cupin domain-containing protein [Chloroflexota bacterium]|nr:cupin domain-containing protein [Chloroflexota bacterium]
MATSELLPDQSVTAAASPAPVGSRTARLRALGSEIRALRRGLGLSTVALARRCDVSPSLISQVERGLTAPSLEVLWAIARALDVPIGTFFQADATSDASRTAATDERAAPAAKSVAVVRAGERKRLGLTPSLTYQLLSPDLQHRIELVWVEFGPGEEGPVEPFTHAGEEQMVVIQGEMQMWIDGQTWNLAAGDAITFDSSVPHRAMNRGSAPAIVIAAITPPSF